MWDRNDPRRAELIARRPATTDEVAAWARDVHEAGQSSQRSPTGKSTSSTQSTTSIPPTHPEIAANAALALSAVALALLDRQLAAQASAFEREGGFTERLYRVKSERRRGP